MLQYFVYLDHLYINTGLPIKKYLNTLVIYFILYLYAQQEPVSQEVLK